MRKYLLVFKNAIETLIEYRFETASKIIVHLFGVGSISFIWWKVVVDNGEIQGYDFYRIITYYLLNGIFIAFISDRVTQHFQQWIQDGDLGNILLKPIRPIGYMLARELGERITIISINIVVFALPFIFIPCLRYNLSINTYSITWFLIFSILSNLFLFTFFWMLGCLAFWFTSLDGLRNTVNNIQRILRGTWFPLDLAPPFFQTILSWLPFQYTLFHPINLLTNNFQQKDNIQGVLVLLLYGLGCFVISSLLWKKGIKHFNSVGI